MRVDFECWGGYAGLFVKKPLTYQMDTDGLPADERLQVLEMVESSGILDLEPQPSSAPPSRERARDVFQYRIAIRDGNRERRFSFDDASAPVALRPFLQYLQSRAIEARRA